MIKNFVDKNGCIYDIQVRGSYQDTIKSARKLKQAIENATSIEGIKKIYPSLADKGARKLHESYNRKTYREIMSLLGIISNAIYKGQK